MNGVCVCVSLVVSNKAWKSRVSSSSYDKGAFFSFCLAVANERCTSIKGFNMLFLYFLQARPDL